MQFEGKGLLKMFDVSGKLILTKEVIGGELLSLAELSKWFLQYSIKIC